MNTTDLTPDLLLKLSGSYWQSCALHAGVQLGIFSIIGSDRLAGEEIARKVGGDVRGVTVLLNALAAMDLVKKQGEHYSLPEGAKNLLVRDSPRYIGHILMHHHHLMDSWSRLSEAVKKGRPIRSRARVKDDQREAFLLGMFNLAMGIAPQMAQRLDLRGRRRLLDLGGGPGTYAIHFCLAHPELRATVYDLPETKPFAEKIIQRFGVSDRVQFTPGDYLHDDIVDPYDVAWLSHILHGEGQEGCQRIINKAVSVLEPGGLIFVHEFILDDTLDGPLFPALFSLNMLLGTKEGQSYSEHQIKAMLKDAGVKEIRRLDFRGPNDSGIIQGEI